MDAALVKDTASIDVIARALGDHRDLLDYRPKVAKAGLYLPGPDFLDRVVLGSNRSPRCCAAYIRSTAPTGSAARGICLSYPLMARTALRGCSRREHTSRLSIATETASGLPEVE